MAQLALPSSLSFSGRHLPKPEPAKTLFPAITHKHQESVIYGRNIRSPHNSLNYSKVGKDTTKMPIVNGVAEFEKDSNFGQILLADVVVKKRNVFWGRKWNIWDVFTLGSMVSTHFLCLLAPFTFNWGAFWVAFSLYIVTGLFGITLSYHRHLAHKSFKIPKWLEYFFSHIVVFLPLRDPIFWVSTHRNHHQFCDSEKDPHSPIEGFWFSRINWLFDSKSIVEKGVRLVWLYHITWLVNSASHVWGKQAWNTGDLSKNNW